MRGLLRAWRQTPLSPMSFAVARYCTINATVPPPVVAFWKVTVASFDAAGLKVLGRGCARGGGTAAVEASVYDLVCGMARQVLLFITPPPFTLCDSCIVGACFFYPGRFPVFNRTAVFCGHRKEEASPGCSKPALDGLTRQKIE